MSEHAEQIDAREQRRAASAGRSPSQQAHDAFWDAVCADDSRVNYCDRDSGEVDAQGAEIVDALLAAGSPPPRTDTEETKP